MKTLIALTLGLSISLPSWANFACEPTPTGGFICQQLPQQYNNNTGYPQPVRPPSYTQPGQMLPSPYYPVPMYQPNQGNQ